MNAPDLLDTFQALGIELRPDGKEYAGLAVWRGDRNPSLRVSPDKGRWFDMARLSVRGEGSGDAFDAIKLALGCDFKEAKRWALERRLIPDNDSSPARSFRPGADTSRGPAPKPLPTPDPRTVEILTAFCNAAPPIPDGSPGARFLEGRAIRVETARRNGLRFVSDPEKATRWLRDRFPLEDLRAAGLLNAGGHLAFSKKHEPTGAWIPFPILIPYRFEGRVLAIQWRRVDDVKESKFAKELLARDVPVSIPWNADALDAAPWGSSVVVCEGVMDALAFLEALDAFAWDCGPPDADAWEPDFPVVVAVPGTGGFKPEFISEFRFHKFGKVFLAYDKDKPNAKGERAGDMAARKVAGDFARAGLPPPIRIEWTGPEKDINDLLKAAKETAAS